MGGRFSRSCAAALFAAALFTPAMAATQLSKPDQQLYDAVDANPMQPRRDASALPRRQY